VNPSIKRKSTICAHIPTRNCVHELSLCLSFLNFVDEIIVADNSSNSDIENLLNREEFSHITHIYTQESDIRKRLLELNSISKSDFILWVHTDEIYTSDLADEILENLRTVQDDVDGFYIPSRVTNFGHDFNEGHTQLRLVRKGKFTFPFDGMHDMPIVKGKTIHLTHYYKHINNPNIGITLIKHIGYERLTAKDIGKNEDLISFLDSKGIKLYLGIFVFWIKSFIRFVRYFLVFRNLGFVGFCLAFSNSFHFMAMCLMQTEEKRIREGKMDKSSRNYRGYL